MVQRSGTLVVKIDHDYLKRLLEACQASKKSTFDIEDLKGYNEPEFEFHMAILDDQGFIRQDDGDRGFGLTKSLDGFLSWSVLPLRLTASGHEFIDSVQNPEVWVKTKAAAKKVGGVGLDLFIQIAKAEAKRFALENLVCLSNIHTLWLCRCGYVGCVNQIEMSPFLPNTDVTGSGGRAGAKPPA